MKHYLPWQRALVVLGTLALIVASLYFARAVLIPVVLAVLLTFILAPLVTQVQRTGLGRIPATLAVVTAAGLVLGSLFLIVVLQVRSLGIELPKHKQVIIEKIESFQELGKGSWIEGLSTSFEEIVDRLNRGRAAAGEPGGPPLKVRLESGDNWGLLWATAGPTLEFLVTVGLVIILVIFMLIGREDLRNRIIRLSGTRRLTNTTRALDDASGRISRFLLMQFVVNLTYGIAAGAGLWLIGVPYALLWGFLATVLRYIPYLGPWLAALFPIALTAAVFPGWGPLLLVITLFIVLELISNNVMEPWLYGRSVGVSELAILVGAAFWTWLWGPLGLVLSAPLTACLVTLGRYVPALEFLHILLGDREVLSRDVAYFQRLLARDEDEATELLEEYMKTHTLDELYEDVVLPALHLVKVNVDRDELSEDDARELHRIALETLESVAPPLQPAGVEAGGSVREALARGEFDESAAEALPLVLGFPVRDEGDELALRMFAHLADRGKMSLEVLPQGTLSGELCDRIREGRASAVCLFTLPPGGITQARVLCKRLRGEFPDLKILVGCWRRDDDPGRLREHLTGAGADAVVTGLVDLRDRLSAQLPSLAARREDREPAGAV